MTVFDVTLPIAYFWVIMTAGFSEGPRETRDWRDGGGTNAGARASISN